MPDKELLKEYALICAKEKQIVGKKAELKAMIEDQLPQESGSFKSPFGKFTMVGTKKWNYTPSVTRLEEDLKILKIEEQESGVAKAEEKFGLRFKAG